MSKRLDAADTIDAVLHYLQTLQSDGWALSSLGQEVDYGQVAKKSALIPIETTLTIKLRPVKE